MTPDSIFPGLHLCCTFKILFFKFYFSNFVFQILFFKFCFSNFVFQILFFKFCFSNFAFQMFFKFCFSNFVFQIHLEMSLKNKLNLMGYISLTYFTANFRIIPSL